MPAVTFQPLLFQTPWLPTLVLGIIPKDHLVLLELQAHSEREQQAVVLLMAACPVSELSSLDARVGSWAPAPLVNVFLQSGSGSCRASSA